MGSRGDTHNFPARCRSRVAALERGPDFGPATPGEPRRRTRNVLKLSLTFGLLFAAAGATHAFLTRPFVATVRLLAYEKTFVTSAEAADFTATATSTSVLARLAATHAAGLTAEELADRCGVAIDHQSPFISVSAVGKTKDAAVGLVNVLAGVVADCADEWVSMRTAEVDAQTSAVQQRMRDLRQQFAGFDDALLSTDVRGVRHALSRTAAESGEAVVALRRQMDALNAEEQKIIAVLAADKPAARVVQQQLEEALARYTEEHPRVKELRASLASLQRSSPPAAKPTNEHLAGLTSRRNALRDELGTAEAQERKSRAALENFATNEVEFVRLQSEYNALSGRRDELIHARVLVANRAVEKWRRAGRPSVGRVTDPVRLGLHAFAGVLPGLGIAGTVLGVSRLRDRRMRTPAALREATGLPVLATLPDLDALSAADREYWAIETLEALRCAAGVPRRGCFVCGFVSGAPREGRSTIIDLLAQAGLRNGNRVLTISRPPKRAGKKAGRDQSGAVEPPVAGPHALLRAAPAAARQRHSLVRYSFNGNPAHGEFQKSWEQAAAAWQAEENAVVLIELPPAARADALLLSSAIPHVVWISSARCRVDQTRRFVHTLRRTGCHLIGAAFNQHAQ